MSRLQVTRRRGTLLVIVLLCLMVVGLTSAGLLRWITLHQRQVRQTQWQQQALWLAESGLSRARQRLAADNGYSGEAWQLDAQQLSRDHAGVVTIQCEVISESDEQQLVVEAIYPADSIHRVTHRIAVPLKTNNSGDTP
ncbi:MAG TPA: hypothetical protein DCY79_13325 [Planctomycetaceae bacterium]|nr:hypothetical protein [Blastopirellula sp.]HAY80782.1 hypothetical protein [Planctomycetaceae bacterium]